MASENPKANPERYPADRRQVVWMRPQLLALLFALALIPMTAAWGQWLLFGLRRVPVLTATELRASSIAPGFPLWLRLAHFVNFLFLMLIIRSGLSILMDHPRLYRNVHCAPGSEWTRFTPVTHIPQDRLYTANDDQRYLSP